MADAPCGDFFWMRHVIDELRVSYVGVDIVPELVDENEAAFASPRVRFRLGDITGDRLPRTDLILCRDALVHLPVDAIRNALRLFRESGATYLLSTTFPEHPSQRDIRAGEWRPLNLEAAPFLAPPPIEYIDEECPEPGFEDKSLGLWRLSDLVP